MFVIHDSNCLPYSSPLLHRQMGSTFGVFFPVVIAAFLNTVLPPTQPLPINILLLRIWLCRNFQLTVVSVYTLRM